MKDREVKTVIIILNYNDYPSCINFINEIKDYKILDRFILVDNHSSDKSVIKLSSYTNDRIQLIESGENKGYAYGNNVGMRYAIERYPNLENIIISNPDIHVSEKDIQRILVPLKKGYGMSTGVIYNFNPISNMKVVASNFGWKIPNYKDMISNCYLLAYKVKRSVCHTSMYLDWEKEKKKAIISTEAVPGCFFALKAEAAQKIDYMDEDTFLFGEETILGWRLKNTGYKACIVNGTEVLHENSISINKSIKANKKKNQYRLEAEIVYLKKCLGCSDLAVISYKVLYRIGLCEKMVIGRFMSWLKKDKNESQQ